MDRRTHPPHPTAVPTTSVAPARLTRMRRLARLLDQSIPVAGFRIGIDPLIGLVPWIGDALGAGLSTIILYDAARLGLPVHVLVKMIGNILLEVVIGGIPVIGDLFDFGWRANARNLALVDKYYDPLRAERPPSRIAHAIAALGILAFLGVLALSIFLLRALWVLIRDAGQ